MKADGPEVTYSVVNSIQWIVSLLQPIIEVLSVVCGVTFSISGHAEDSHGVLNLTESGQFRLDKEYKPAKVPYSFRLGD